MARHSSRSVIVALLALAAWNVWECTGLYSDGAYFFVERVHARDFWITNDSRLFVMATTQAPLILALSLGITDLHWLARIHTFGLMCLPVALYCLALTRAAGDEVLLAAVIAAITAVFFSTSFFIVGEYNVTFAIVLAAATLLASTERPQVIVGLVLGAQAILSLYTYQLFLYFGPLLGAMTIWTVRRQRSAAVMLYMLAAAFFFGAGATSAYSLMTDSAAAGGAVLLQGAALFGTNVLFIAPLVAGTVLVVWAVARPRELKDPRPYICAALPLMLLLLTPALGSEVPALRPRADRQYYSAFPASITLLAIVGFIFLRRVWPPFTPRLVLSFALVAFVAAFPAQIYLTLGWMHAREAMRDIIWNKQGIVSFADTRLPSEFIDPAFVSSLSLALRAGADSARLMGPGASDYLAGEPMPDLGSYVWRR